MSLEANLVEQIQELQKWQQQQKDLLMLKQQEQIEKLNDEQVRVVELLSASIDELNFDDQSLIKELITEDQKTKEEEDEEIDLIDLTTDDDFSVQPKSKDYYKFDLSKEMENNEDFLSEKPRSQQSSTTRGQNNSKFYSSFYDDFSSNLSSDFSQSFCSDKLQKSILIDDLPVPSPRKDFSTLLEEKLKDYEAVQTENTKKTIVKRPFLKKGEGLARFKPNPNKINKKPRCTAKSGIQSSAPKPSSSTNVTKRTNVTTKPTTRDLKKNNTNTVLKKNISPAPTVTQTRFGKKNDSLVRSVNKKSIPPVPPVAQAKLNLKNVPVSQKKIINKSAINLQKKFTTFDEKNKNLEVKTDVSNSDLEGKTKKELEEVRIFELLEDKAENSSFCSTSSTVIAFLQQSSTPLKHKALMHSATKHHISFNNVGDQTLEEIVNTTESNNLTLPKKQRNDENISKWEVIHSQLNNKETDDEAVLPYGTDIDLNYVENLEQELNEDQNNISLHVRFSEYNEYKTMSDASSVSSEPDSIHDFKNQGVWSDNSDTPENSDIESVTQQLNSVDLHKSHPYVSSRIYQSKETDDSECDEEESQSVYDQNNDDDDDESEQSDEVCDVDSKNDDTITSLETVIDKNERDTLFKSELLKKRLLQLEFEIETFRKESAALNNLKKKLQDEQTSLQEERIKMQRCLKEKEAALEAEKKKTESILQEEKRRLAREKTALESRMKDAYEKAKKSKHERQEIQKLRQQLEELKDEIEQKESKWSASSARQRSQMRVLQAENNKLKQEIEQIQQKQKARIKKSVNQNTRAIHVINKTLGERKKKLPVSNNNNEEPVHHVEEVKKISQVYDDEIDQETVEDKPTEVKKLKVPKSIESIKRTRNLYEQLLKDATEDVVETQINGRHLSNPSVEFKDTEEDEEEEDDDDGNQLIEEVLRDYEKSPKHTDAVNFESLELSLLSHQKNKTDFNQPKVSENKQNVKEIFHSDGRIEYWYPNGNVKKIFPDKGLTKMIYYNGDVRETNKEGIVKYFYAENRTWHTTMPDGLEILEFPDGQVERKSKDGSCEIAFNDGSVKIIQPDGTEKWAMRDGTVSETTADGDKILSFPNGQREIHAKDHKRREYPDGTVKIVYLDGTQETRYANGRIRVKDKDGNLLLDTYQ